MTIETFSQFSRRPNLDSREIVRADLAHHFAALIRTETSLTTAIPGLTLHCHSAPTQPYTGTYEPSVALVIQGRKQVNVGRLTFIQGGNRFLLTSVDLPVTSRVIEASALQPYMCLRLKLDMAVVGDVLTRELEASALPLPQGDAPAMSTAETTVEMLDAFKRLLMLHSAPQDVGFMNGLIQREIIYRILHTPEGRRLRAIATLGDASQRTAKAIEWIRGNYDKPLRVEALAQLACMGVSTLHQHFRALTSMSPLQYQKQLRLHEARRRMLIEGADAASAAFGVGYESASQFNREYSRLFGQPPMRDMRALRLTSHVEAR
jgi:AraC-like DNA-binding protein